MDLRVFTEPQLGATYDDLLAVALVAEEEGYGAFFRSDHYLATGTSEGLPGPTDAWTTLAGLARDTTTIRLGTLVTSATFRLPGPFAVVVAQVDAMCGGRLELGLGTGWYAPEHLAFGIPLPAPVERFDRLTEQLELITAMWTMAPGEVLNFDGRYYRLTGNPCLARPLQRPFPIILGGRGRRRTPQLAARFAAEYNTPFLLPDVVASQNAAVTQACESMGRDPTSLLRSAAVVVCCGADRREVERRAAQIGLEVDELREQGVCGTPEEVAAQLMKYAEAGAQRVYLQVLDLKDLDHLRLIAREVYPLI